MRKRVMWLIAFLFLVVCISNCKKDDIGDSTESEKPYPSDLEDPYPSEIEDRYIVFFLTNTSVDQAASMNGGKDANKRYTFVEEIPKIFGELEEDSPYKYAYGLPGPMLLTQSIEEMNYQVNKAFDLAEEFDVPVYFQLDDCNNYTDAFGSGATPKFYENPDWCEWVDFPTAEEDWGGQSHGRLPYYWFNWGSWIHVEAFPCFQSPGFCKFVTTQMQDGVLDPLMQRYNQLIAEGKEYLFAGMAIGWETHIPDYSINNTNINRNNLPVNSLAGDQMPLWEATEFGYHSLHLKGYDEYSLSALDTVLHDYIELLSKTAYNAGVPKEKIFSHIVGIRSAQNKVISNYPPIWTAVNDYCIPGFTMSPVTAPYDLYTLTLRIKEADNTQQSFACAEGYARGVDGSFAIADDYFDSMFKKGASLVTVYGWGRAAATSKFAVSHSTDNPFVIAAGKWLGMNPADNTKP
ncbi:hypothetical protein ACUNWD_13105 [Sunxiuqinia sp. A32]|uniref:hypothetical protein n=1 Tax=Sunxiuqinia sp. A32 TaxID=3461496 RepID=UPI00404539E7